MYGELGRCWRRKLRTFRLFSLSQCHVLEEKEMSVKKGIQGK